MYSIVLLMGLITNFILYVINNNFVCIYVLFMIQLVECVQF